MTARHLTNSFPFFTCAPPAELVLSSFSRNWNPLRLHEAEHVTNRQATNEHAVLAATAGAVRSGRKKTAKAQGEKCVKDERLQQHLF